MIHHTCLSVFDLLEMRVSDRLVGLSMPVSLWHAYTSQPPVSIRSTSLITPPGTLRASQHQASTTDAFMSQVDMLASDVLALAETSHGTLLVHVSS